MFSQGLSLDQAPPFSAPLLFFITAPLFGIMVGVLLLFGNPDNFAYRGSLPFLAVAHTLFVGFVAMVMMGAMQQMLPVIAGAKFPRPLLNSRLIYLPTVTGTILLVTGLWTADSLLLKWALGLLLFGFGFFLLLSGYALAKASQRSESVRAFSFAFASLGIAVGFAMAAGLAYAGKTEYHAVFAHLHIAWMVLGWVMLLVIGVSFQVVPMFYVAEAYNPFCRTKGAMTVFTGLIVYTTAKIAGTALLASAVLLLILAVVTGFATVTILRLYRRKRAVKDSNIRFWYLAMGSLIGGILLWGVGYFLNIDRMVTAGGIVIAIGFAVSLISAMLYKIVPFLVWFHLTNMGHFGIPTMRDLIVEQRIRLHLYLHLGALLVFIAASLSTPRLYMAGGALFMLSNLLLLINLAQAGRFYMKKRSEPVIGLGEWKPQ